MKGKDCTTMAEQPQSLGYEPARDKAIVLSHFDDFVDMLKKAIMLA